MRLLRRLALPCSIALLLATAPNATAAPLFTRVQPTAGLRAGTAASAAASLSLLRVDERELAAFRASEGGAMELPLADGSIVTLQLARADVLAPGASITFNDGTGEHAIRPDVACFRGTVTGDANGWAAITLAADGVHGAIERGGERWQIEPAEAASPGALALHAFAPETRRAEDVLPFNCGVDGATELDLSPNGLAPRATPRTTSPNSAEISATRRRFDIAIDCDYEIYTKFSSNATTAANYVISVMNVVSLIYERDLEVTLRVPYLNVWTIAADPYTSTTTSGGLSEIKAYWMANRTGVSRAVAHLISGKPMGGGIAYVDVLCSSSFGYGVSAIDAAYTYPTNSTTWDANVLAHELGHNFGSYHTHSCNWQALGYITTNALIDSCQAGEGGCLSPTLHVPPDKGTIMSYCHLLTGGMNNVRLDFHPVCITHMRGRIDAAVCGTNPVPQPPGNPLASATATGVTLSWTASSSPSVLSYDVYRSRTMLDAAPVKIGTTAGLTFDDVGFGTQYYKVRAVRAADTSAFCAEMKLNLCGFTTRPSLTTGSLPSAVVTGDFNTDGHVDVAFANNGAGSVSVVLGTGTGTFGPPAALLVADEPACLATADVNLDGILDLLVGTALDSSVYVHLGNGSAGVGNGTFGAGTRIAMGAQPTTIASADFNEDGYLDLVVAGSTSGVQIVRGQGTGGIPDGTFAPSTTITLVGGSRGVVVGDFNEDGIWDIATTGTGMKVLRGNGTAGKGNGTFTGPTLSNTGGTPYEIACADLNLDGIDDLLVANSGASSVSVFLGNGSAGVGSGTFPLSGTAVSVGINPRGIAIADWSGDGIPDLAVANSSTTAKTIGILSGKGDGTFNTVSTMATNTKTMGLAVSDFNEDTGADLIAFNNGANSITVVLGGCTMPASLALTAPAGGETWISGEEHTISWTRGPGSSFADVQLSYDGGASWTTIAQHVDASSFTWSVTPAGSAQARIRVVDPARPQVVSASGNFTIVPQSALGVDEGALRQLALRGAWPNPSRGSFAVAFTLPTGGQGATLELLDLAGRRVVARDLTAFGPGLHSVTLDGGTALRPGMYVLRLARAADVSTRKVAVIR